MKNRVRFFFLFLGLLGALAVHAQINELPRSTPEAEGVPSKAVTALFDSLMHCRKQTSTAWWCCVTARSSEKSIRLRSRRNIAIPCIPAPKPLSGLP